VDDPTHWPLQKNNGTIMYVQTKLTMSSELASHKSLPVQARLAAHPEVQQVFLPVGACGLNLQASWWPLFRREPLADYSLANGEESKQATATAPQQLHPCAVLWV
jgi:hypothetical protein